MNLIDYFEFQTFDFEAVGKIECIRVKGSGIDIEHIIEPYLKCDSPERIYHGYRHSLSLEQVYATITYYLANRTQLDEYLKKGNEVADFYYQEYLKKEPSPALKRLRELKAKAQAGQPLGSQ